MLLKEGIMKASPETEAAVMAAVAKSFRAYENRDVGAVLSSFVTGPDIVVIGTGADEKCVGTDEARKQLERDFAQSESASWEVDWRSVSAEGPVAWVAADVVLRGKAEGRDFAMPLRYTAVVVQQGGAWLVAQQHLSAPLAGQETGRSFPAPAG